jgi:hypothetical protein
MRFQPALVAGLWAALICAPAAAQEASAPSPEAPAPAVEGSLPAGTAVRIELAQPVSSKTNKRGDRFAIALAQPIISEVGVLVPAGVPGVGEVVSAARKGYGGQAGELVLAARYLDYGGRQIPLRGLKLTGLGHDSTKGMNFCKAIFQYCSSSSTDIELPAGIAGDAKLAADISLPVIAPVPAPASPSAPNPTEDQ